MRTITDITRGLAIDYALIKAREIFPRTPIRRVLEIIERMTDITQSNPYNNAIYRILKNSQYDHEHNPEVPPSLA